MMEKHYYLKALILILMIAAIIFMGDHQYGFQYEF